MPRVNDPLSEILDEIELPLPQPQSPLSSATHYTPRTQYFNQIEIDELLASHIRATTTVERRASPQQPLDFDPNNLTISERVGLNDMGIHRPRYYKRTGDKS